MKNKKSLRSKIIMTIIAVATVFIVFSSVRIGLKLAEQVEDNETKSEKKSLNGNEKTQDFIITYNEETYKVNNDKSIIIENRRTNPTITSGKYPVSADKIVSYLKNYLDSKWTEMNSTANSYKKTDNDKNVGVDIVVSSIEQNDLYFSIKINTTGSLGDSKLDEEKVYSFDTKNGNILSFKDISSDEVGFKQAIYKELYNTIANQEYAKDLDAGWNKRLIEEMNSEGNWSLSKEGITFVFPSYSFGPGHIGKIKHTIKYSKINNYLSNEYKKNA